MMPTVSDQSLHDHLKATFGYDEFRPGQIEVVRQVAGGGDALVLMPTGGGKSLCYQLPAIVRDGLTLVVSPLIALMKDQVDALKVAGVEAACLNSTVEASEVGAIMRSAENGTLKLLYVAPERLALPGFASWLDERTLSLIAIDEAHCISEWGHDFRPDYRNLRSLRERFAGVPLVALTATATGRVQDDIAAQLGLEAAPRFSRSFNRVNLTYRVRPKGSVAVQVRGLLATVPNEAVIVYCFSRNDCERLSAELARDGVAALPYHAGLPPETRQLHQEKFMRDETQVMVATIAFGMGIDKPDIRMVIHADLPKTLEGYYQETGRAGRDGLPAECVLLFSAGDRMKQEFFIREIEDEAERAAARRKLEEVTSYCRLGDCRRRYLLAYFGETDTPELCNACDICLEPPIEFDATVTAQKILSAVVRTGQRFGSSYVATVLVGKNDRKVRERGHEALSVFGIIKDHDETAIKDLIEQLVLGGYLIKQGDEYPTLAVTRRGESVLKGALTVSLREPAIAKIVTKPRRRDVLADAPDVDAGLFERLRALRRQLASEQGVPPYIVFGDAALIAMARMRPETLEAMAAVPGVGDAKLERYGEAFVTEITAYGLEARSG